MAAGEGLKNSGDHLHRNGHPRIMRRDLAMDKCTGIGHPARLDLGENMKPSRLFEKMQTPEAKCGGRVAVNSRPRSGLTEGAASSWRKTAEALFDSATAG
jgi:hypothetical protein